MNKDSELAIKFLVFFAFLGLLMFLSAGWPFISIIAVPIILILNIFGGVIPLAAVMIIYVNVTESDWYCHFEELNNFEPYFRFILKFILVIAYFLLIHFIFNEMNLNDRIIKIFF